MNTRGVISTREARRPLLAVVLVSIAVNAALGIYALVAPGFGDTQGKILTTSACVTGAGLFALACLPALERGKLMFLPPLGVAASVAGFGLLVLGLWLEADSAPVWKSAGTLLLVGGWAALSSLLSLARLAPRFQWSFRAAVALGLIVTALGVAGMWAEVSSDGFWRGFGVVAVLLGALTLAIPVLQRVSRDEVAAEAPEGRPVRFCPACGHELRAGVAVECEACGARFSVRYHA
jgi:hypothetical protein